MSSFAHDSPELAEAYDRLSDTQLENGRGMVERLSLAEGARVLDVGCGTGRLAGWMREKVGPRGAVTGVDPLADRVAIARSSVPGARFEVGKAEDLGLFGDASFDAVTMSSTLHWVADKEKALSEIRRVLRPGGRLGVTTFPQELASAGTSARVIEPLLRSPPYAEHVDLSKLTFARKGGTTTDHVNLVLAGGLELEELRVYPRIIRHESGETFVRFLDASAFGNLLRIVPEALRSRFRADLVAGFDAMKGPEGVVTRDWGMLFVASRR